MQYYLYCDFFPFVISLFRTFDCLWLPVGPFKCPIKTAMRETKIFHRVGGTVLSFFGIASAIFSGIRICTACLTGTFFLGDVEMAVWRIL